MAIYVRQFELDVAACYTFVSLDRYKVCVRREWGACSHTEACTHLFSADGVYVLPSAPGQLIDSVSKVIISGIIDSR